MKWFQQNRELGTLLVGCGIGVLLAAALLFWRWSAWSGARQAFDRAAAEQSRLAHLDELVLDWVRSPDFDRLLVDTVQTTFPSHERDHFIAHYRGLLELWAKDEDSALSRS